MSEISKEEYLKVCDAVERLHRIIWENQIITSKHLDEADEIYNEAEMRTFSEDKP